MNLNYLKVFTTVAKVLSFTKASEILHITQPTVSVQIKNLEKELDVKLFKQKGKTIFLTDAGQLLYDYTGRIFQLVSELEVVLDDYKDLGTGNLLLGASTTPGTYLLPKVLAKFKRNYPGISITLDIGNTEDIEAKLIRNELEIALVGEESNLNKNLNAEPITTDELLLVLSKENKLLQTGKVELKAILEESFIMREPGSSTRIAIEDKLKALNKEVKIAMQLNNPEAIKEAVKNNLGISFMSSLSVNNGDLDTLAVFKIPELTMSRKLNLIYYKNSNLSLASKAFVKILKENLEIISLARR